jgi:hypothetical protein
MVELFRAQGVRAEHLDGATPGGERSAILSRLAEGKTELVSNVGVLTEGWDLPALRCVILARPTKSVGLYLQMAGRGLRPAEGKTVARIHDHAGNALRHGPVDLDREYTLECGGKREGGEGRPSTRTCPQCRAVFAAGHEECPACGASLARELLPRQVQEIEGVEVSLDEVRQRYVPSDEALSAYLKLVSMGAARGFKLGWASFRFKERYGFWPRREWTQRFRSPGMAAPIDVLSGQAQAMEGTWARA